MVHGLECAMPACGSACCIRGGHGMEVIALLFSRGGIGTGVMMLVLLWAAQGCSSPPDWVATWVYDSDLIVVGEVAEHDTASGRIPDRVLQYTTVTLSLVENLRGKPASDALTFRIRGDLRESPRSSDSRKPLFFAPGDTVLACLKVDENGRLECHYAYAELIAGRAHTSFFGVVDTQELIRDIDGLVSDRTPSAIAARADLVVTGDVVEVRRLDRHHELVLLRTVDAWVGVADEPVLEIVVGTTIPFRSNDVPLLKEGESVVAFLKRQASGRFHIVGNRDGVYVIGESERTTAVRTPRRLPATGISGHAMEVCTSHVPDEPIDLSILQRIAEESR